MLPGDPITQTLRCTARADSTGGTVQLLQLAIALREYQLPLHALHWRAETDTAAIIIELTSAGPPALLERLAERISTIGGVHEVSLVRPA
ncbi:MAG: hypothetical protein Q8M02_00915 [Candidatus Didemnitutus sp.]|nr:hypothetical protein [Candidatus Didemnitutus sp.]